MLAIFRDREGKRLIEVGYHGRKNMVALALIRRGERGEREGGEEKDGKKRWHCGLDQKIGCERRKETGAREMRKWEKMRMETKGKENEDRH